MVCAFCGTPITGKFMSDQPRRLADGRWCVDHFHADQGPYVEDLPTCAMRAAESTAREHLGLSAPFDGVLRCHVGRS